MIAMLGPCLVLLGGQSEPPNATTSQDDLLRGPTVPDHVMQTLVNIDMVGKFIPLQGRPEEAALGLVLIDQDHREGAHEVAQARRLAIGMLLVDNIDTVKDASDAIRAVASGSATAG